jgi:hypothetical protein
MWQPLKGIVLGTAIVLALAAQATAAGPAKSSRVYSVGSVTVPGVDTGLVLKQGRSVTVTATGTVCPGTGYCTSPGGNPAADTSSTAFGGFLQPSAPAYGLVGRVGTGPWTQIGDGPTTLSGTGELVFAFNDDLYADNAGSFTVTVSYARGSAAQTSAPCQPGWGHGDTNHDHTGPPGQSDDACSPGHGYGDKNHDHSGPPGPSGESSETSGGRGKPHH